MPRAKVPERFAARAIAQRVTVAQQQAVTVAVTEVAAVTGDITAATELIAEQQAVIENLTTRVNALEETP